MAMARPDGGYAAPGRRDDDSQEHIAILRDDRHFGDDGSFSHDFETENGIYISRSGSRLDDVEYEPVGQQGEIK